MNEPKFNIFENISEEEYRIVRRRMIESILATDMANHSKHLTQLKSKLDALNILEGVNIEQLVSSENVNKQYESQQIVMNMIIHAADVSNPGKPLKIYNTWVKLVFAEFFNQGDLERTSKLPISLLCDRESTNISKSQLGFINFIVKPTFDCIINLLPQVSVYMDNMRSNCKYYEELIKSEEEKKNTHP